MIYVRKMEVLSVKKLPPYKVIYLTVNNVISRLFQKWCSSGVVSTSLSRTIVDFIGFFEILQDTAVIDEYVYLVLVDNR